MMGPLVTTEWLAGELGAPDLVVLDASFYLPAENRDADAEFARAHIPGARRFASAAAAKKGIEVPDELIEPIEKLCTT